jgi:hypothetical protein
VRLTRFVSPVRRIAYGSIMCALVAAGLVVGPAAHAATFNVNCGAGGNLQSRLNTAPSGSTILIEGTCHGNFTINGPSLTLRGNPTATLDGMDAGRTLDNEAASKALHLAHLTITGGAGVGGGAGVFSDGPTTLYRVKITGNESAGTGEVDGGGIDVSLDLTVTSSTISGNRGTVVGSTGAGVAGGGIFTDGALTITDSVVSGNQATASTASGATLEALGGGIFVGGKLTITNTKITNNRVGTHGNGGLAAGSAVYVSTGPTVSVSHATLSGNNASAVSTTSTDATADGTIFVEPAGATLTVTGSTLSGNTASASAPTSGAEAHVAALGATSYSMTVTGSSVRGNTGTASGASAEVQGLALGGNVVHMKHSAVSGNVGKATASAGGATALGTVNADDVTLTTSTLDRNTLVATATGGNALATGAGVHTSSVTALATTISRNSVTAKATTSGHSANATGGGIATSSGGPNTIKNSTIALNHVKAASPNPGGMSSAVAGGIDIDPASSTFTDDTIAGNTVVATGGSVTAHAGGLYANASTVLKGTIIANNTAPVGPDCFGGPTSGGYNLIRKTLDCPFVKKSTDKVHVDPRLGVLASNGGPTQTVGLKPASPAHDAIPKLSCLLSADQRRVHRPQGPKCDIGAFELRPGEVVPT